MARTILWRLIYALPIAFGVGLVCFMLVYLAPGDPLQTVLPPDANAETIEIVKKAYGFDKPLPVQFANWAWRAAHGDFGLSVATRRPVADEVGVALVNTLELTLLAVPISFVIGAGMGTLAGCAPEGGIGRAIDRLVTGTAVLGVSVPNYWLGLVMVIVFAVEYSLLPASGMGANGSDAFSAFRWEDFRYLILPVITLSLVPVGIIARTTRAAVLEVRGQDFVTTLRAKGLTEPAIVRHVLKNAAPGMLAVMGLQFGYLMGGSILVEPVFNWPGSGSLLGRAIVNRDVPVLQGAILSLSLIFVATNLIVDLLQAAIDPRVRRA
jgi:peptide/nickel transport system permease protein